MYVEIFSYFAVISVKYSIATLVYRYFGFVLFYFNMCTCIYLHKKLYLYKLLWTLRFCFMII